MDIKILTEDNLEEISEITGQTYDEVRVKYYDALSKNMVAYVTVQNEYPRKRPGW